MRRALVTGITGQIGSYLAESLLTKGYPTVRFLDLVRMMVYADTKLAEWQAK